MGPKRASKRIQGQNSSTEEKNTDKYPSKRVKRNKNECSTSFDDKKQTENDIVNEVTSDDHKQMNDNKLPAIGVSWSNALASEFSKEYFINLMSFLKEERISKTIYPPEDEVFSWTNFHQLADTKVVVLGQDPYHGPNEAHGLSFSVKVGVPLPPSLKNMYKELETDIIGFVKPLHGHLVGWAMQGVLLLNACLTVVADKPNSHKSKGWEKFTDAVITCLDSDLDGIVFILWGKDAQKKGKNIDRNKHLVLEGAHPSPLSAYRGFFGCKHFSKANDFLREKGKKEIDWANLPESG